MTVTSGGIEVADGGFTQSDGVIHVTGGTSVYSVGLKFEHTGLETLDSFVGVTGGLTVQNFGIDAMLQVISKAFARSIRQTKHPGLLGRFNRHWDHAEDYGWILFHQPR